MDLENILQSFICHKHDNVNENGCSKLCNNNLTENQMLPEFCFDSCDFLQKMGRNDDFKQHLNDKDEGVTDFNEFHYIFGAFNENGMLEENNNIKKSVNNNCDSSIETRTLFDLDYSNVVFRHSVVQNEADVKHVGHNDLFNTENVVLNNKGKIEIEIEPFPTDNTTDQSQIKSSLKTPLPGFQEAFKNFINAPFNTFTQEEVRIFNVHFDELNANHSQKHLNKENGLQTTDESDDDITLENNLKFIENGITNDDDFEQKLDVTTAEYDSECPGYNSSDFECISESEAKMCGLFLNGSNKLKQRNIKNKAKSYTAKDCKHYKYAQEYTHRDEEDRVSDHIIPEGDDYFNLFQGNNEPIVPIYYRMENKSVVATAGMAVEYGGIGFDMRTMGRDDIDDDELKEDAKKSVKKILELYPYENCERKRRH